MFLLWECCQAGIGIQIAFGLHFGSHFGDLERANGEQMGAKSPSKSRKVASKFNVHCGVRLRKGRYPKMVAQRWRNQRKKWEKVSRMKGTYNPKASWSARSWICKKPTGNGGLSTFYRVEAAYRDVFWKRIWSKCRFGCQVGQKTAFGRHFSRQEAAKGSQKVAKLTPKGSQDEPKWQ